MLAMNTHMRARKTKKNPIGVINPTATIALAHANHPGTFFVLNATTAVDPMSTANPTAAATKVAW
jgi:hypothetical protein